MPIPLSVTFKDAKKFNIQNSIGNLLSQVNANKISDAKVKQLLGQAKDEEFQARLDRLGKKVDKSYDDDNNNNSNNINFDDSDDDDDNNVGEEKLRRKYSNLRWPIILSNDNNEEELYCRYNNLHKTHQIQQPSQNPIVKVLKTDFDRPITNLIDKPTNIIEMVPKNEKQDLDKYDIHLS